ncbi:Uncharacterized conserved protein YlxW, UPF0749 family [Nocardioides terrae]|uniref:Uncharacterized conserved protein YlxW, UPF0749 family n=1 Tax=Nocardioides terrae TaxID=574651 RepID=A0A1I1NDP0_9ACTN|nr:DUF881 domain-containing protein [Nocardioides terrae]SFC95667.1 Uncharacterized conserved protein YlxW, UPF0749 family [Nocardioides terrae]
MPREHAAYAAAAGALPPRVTAPLLDVITRESLDEDYQHVAEQRRAGVRPPAEPTGRSVRTVVTILIFGALLAVAAVQTARSAEVTSAGREQLISRIETRRANLADVQDRIARLHTDNASAEGKDADVGQRLSTVTATRADLEARTGFAAVSGPGVRIIVDDSPDGGMPGRVRDNDLALLVNGLWKAGASAVSINGQRVSVLSSLRNSGQAIGINGVSLSPPYTVLAVGDRRTLQADLAESASGSEFASLTERYGMSVTMQDRDEVRLPAAPPGMMTLHSARADNSAPAKPPVNKEDSP